MTEAATVDTTTVDTSTTEPAAEPAAEPAVEPAAEPAPAAKPADDGSTEEPVVHPDEWSAVRERIAKGDEKLSKRLARYSSIDSAIEALIAAQNKLSSGALKSALPKDATPEQLAAWREENGIPATPEEYDMTLPDGLTIGEEDLPVVDNFKKLAHESNMTPEQTKNAVAWYLNYQEQVAEEQAQQDLAAKQSGTQALQEAWGTEAKLNLSLIDNLLSTAPEGTKELITDARLGDGTPLGSHPGVLRFLADLARQINPVATVVPHAGANASQAIETELAGIEKLMAQKDSEYWKGPGAAKMQERYRQLVDVKLRTEGKK